MASKIPQSKQIIKNKNQPSVKCHDCNKNVTAVKFPGLSCCICKKFYHGACVELSNETLETIRDSGVDWTCLPCRPKNTLRKSLVLTKPATHSQMNSSSHDKSGSHEGNVDHSKVTADLIGLKSTVDAMQSSIQFFSDKFDDFKAQLDVIEELLSRVTFLESKTAALEEKVLNLTDRFNTLEANSNDRDLILCGIPEIENDQFSTADLVIDFLKASNSPKISPNDIKCAFRVKSKSAPPTTRNAKKPPKILVKFHSSKKRDSIKFAIRSLKNQTKLLPFYNHNIDFYAADHLTPNLNQLLYTAKDVAASKNCFRVWVSNSSILVKKTSTSKPIYVRNFDDLNKI
jgi:hypothetical protein